MDGKQGMYRYRLLRCIVIEAATPLAVGSGDKGIMTDAAVARDANGLPYIPGSSIAGVIRHAMAGYPGGIGKWMGSQDKGEGGSRLAVTDARMLDSTGTPADGLRPDAALDPLLKHFTGKVLPIRQHVCLSHLGTAKDTGKFDEEVVPAGTRFCFEMELLADEGEEEEARALMESVTRWIQADTFRIGGGTRSGIGGMVAKQILKCQIDLKDKAQLVAYLSKSSRLDPHWFGFEAQPTEHLKDSGFIHYKLDLIPDGFMFFGSGLGSPDADADMDYVRNPVVTWEDDGDNGNCTGRLVDEDDYILIPASSLKGALSHRTAYYYNQLEGVLAGRDSLKPSKFSEHTGSRNKAVQVLFGSAGDDGTPKSRGLAIFSDITKKKPAGVHDKILNHVSIDRFTGGATNGALFDEKALYARGVHFTTEILVNRQAKAETYVIEAFERALDDACNGLLPLGGGVNRGNGTFSMGKWHREDD